MHKTLVKQFIKINIALIFTLCINWGITQNEVYRCQKTTWDISSIIQIDTYNVNDQLLEYFRIEGNGDTSQWHINKYIAQGLISSSTIRIDIHCSYEKAKFRYDTFGKLLYTVVIGYHHIDTLFEDNSIQYDEHGNQLNYPKWKYPEIDSVHYEYNKG